MSRILVILIFLFLIWNAWQGREIIKSLNWDLDVFNLGWLFIFVLFVYLTNVFSWHLVTRALGAEINFPNNLKVWMLSNAARLLPGGIWQYPSRVYMLGHRGVTKNIAATSVFLETMLNLSIGAFVTLLSLFFWNLPEEFSKYKGALLALSLSAFIVMLFINSHKRVFNFLLRKVFKDRALTDYTAPTISPWWFFLLFFAFLAKFLVFGAVLFFVARLVFPVSLDLLPFIIGSAAFSWILGYIAFFTPGGLGVTEASLSAVLSPTIPFSVAIVIAIGFRFFLLLAECVFLGIAFLLKVSDDYKNQENQ